VDATKNADAQVTDGCPGDGRSGGEGACALEKAADELRRGGVVAFPTETVYGLGADAFNPKAVARVFEIKQRPSFDPLIVHIDDRAKLSHVALDVPPAAEKLMAAFWPGPLTIVLQKTPLIPDLVTSGLPTVAVRMPAHDMALSLIRACGVPLCAPSANPFGYVSPTRAEHVVEQLGALVDRVLDGGPCAVGIESTIVDVTDGAPRILRPGVITAEALSLVLGEDVCRRTSHRAPLAPGMLPRHYSPRVPIALFEGTIPAAPGNAAGLLLQGPREVPAGYALVEVLSRNGDPAEVAHHLFAALRQLDRKDLDILVVELADERGIGRAINDRLRRAGCRDGADQG